MSENFSVDLSSVGHKVHWFLRRYFKSGPAVTKISFSSASNSTQILEISLTEGFPQFAITKHAEDHLS
jgi:hypothetical protein